jgi:hypothetical protein
VSYDDRLRKGFGCRVASTLGKGKAPILHELIRHSSMQVTMDYYASVDDVLQDAINELSRRTGTEACQGFFLSSSRRTVACGGRFFSDVAPN